MRIITSTRTNLWKSIAALSLAGACALASAQGVYRVMPLNGIWWFSSPNGQPLWSFGVDCTDLGVAPKDVKTDNPGYSGLTLFPDEKSWVLDTARRLRSWGFNSLGGWSDADLFAKYAGKERMPYFPVLHLGAYDKAPWHDLFAPQMEKAIDGAAKSQILKVKDDPHLVGYFTDNELGWWTDTLFMSYLEMPSDSPGRKVLMRLIRSHYRNRFDLLKKDWATAANGFADLEKKADLKLRAGSDGIKLVDAWTTALAKRYYSMVWKAVRRYDRKHLILGDRYCQYYDLPVAKAAAPYVDVISTNMSADWTDGGTSRFFLDTLHRLTGKPVIITEFYMTAMENQTGNRNTSGGFPIVQTQQERAAAFRRNVAELAARPYLVGAHWFQYYDEPAKGRGDGEDYNMGLVDVKGKPYPLLTRVASELRVSERHAKAADMTIANTAAPAPAELKGGLLHWDRARCVVAPAPGVPFGDLYVSWKDDALYVGLYAMDYMDEKLYEGGKLPEVDRPTWTLRIEGLEKPLTIRYGGEKRPASANVPGVEVVSEIPGLKHTVVLKIPVSLLGGSSLTPGMRVRVNSTLASHSRAERMSWNREVRLVR